MFYIKIKNFKAYQESDWIKLAPITLIYGVNSSGKSAIVQSCRIIASLLGTIRRSTNTFDSNRRRLARSQSSGMNSSSHRISLSGPDESGQIFDFGDYKQVVFGQDTTQSMSFAVRYSPNKEQDKQRKETALSIPIHLLEHKFEATIGEIQDDPVSAKIERLRFSFKSAAIGRHLWHSVFDEEHPHEIDHIRHLYDDDDAEKQIKDLLPQGIDEIVLPSLELELEQINSEEIEIPKFISSRSISQVYEISQASIQSLQNTLKPFIKKFFPDQKSWFNSKKRFFVAFGPRGSIYCVNETNARRVEKNLEPTWTEFPETLELEEQSEDNRKLKLRGVITPQYAFFSDPEDMPEPEVDHGFMIAQLIKDLCTETMRFYNVKFGSINHIPGFRGQPARYEGALDNRTSPLSAALAYLSENPNILNLVIQDLKKLGLNLAATPQSVRFAGAKLDSFDFKPVGHKEVILTLADMGFGISQIIPILTAIRQKSGTFHHTLIEEPEAHLHPSLQGNLMEHFAINSRSRIQAAFEHLDREDPPSEILETHDFVIETHSENLVTRVQKLISQGKINHKYVSVVFCDQKDGIAQTKEIKISSKGKLMDPWPNDFIEPLFDDL